MGRRKRRGTEREKRQPPNPFAVRLFPPPGKLASSPSFGKTRPRMINLYIATRGEDRARHNGRVAAAAAAALCEGSIFQQANTFIYIRRKGEVPYFFLLAQQDVCTADFIFCTLHLYVKENFRLIFNFTRSRIIFRSLFMGHTRSNTAANSLEPPLVTMHRNITS